MLDVFWKYFEQKFARLPQVYASHGAFSCSKHLGKPLTPELYHDLLYRLGAKRLAVFVEGPRERDARLWRHASDYPQSVSVILAEDVNGRDLVVKDVLYQPWYS